MFGCADRLIADKRNLHCEQLANCIEDAIRDVEAIGEAAGHDACENMAKKLLIILYYNFYVIVNNSNFINIQWNEINLKKRQ